MDDVPRGLALLLFGVTITWLGSVLLGRLIARRGLAVWVWDRSGAAGRVLLGIGLTLVAVGFSQGSGPAGSPLILFGSLLLMAGTWLIMPGL